MFLLASSNITSFWRELDRGYENSTGGRDLRGIVACAPWPDKQGDGHGLTAFAEYVYPKDQLNKIQVGKSFEGYRRAVATAFERYGRDCGSAIDTNGVFREWLRSQVFPLHSPTIKITMYLGIALAARIGEAPAMLDNLYKLRDVMESTVTPPTLDNEVRPDPTPEGERPET